MLDAIKSIGVTTPGGTDAIEMSTVSPTSATSQAQGPDFSEMLGGLFTNTAETVKKAEAISIAGVKGQATVQQVVEAVMNAEQSVQGAIAVRDKVVAAYLEISRMQI